MKIGATHAGISVGEDGATHQCCEDMALMRTIPGMVVCCPCDGNEMKAAVKEDKVIFRQRAFVPVEREYAGEVCFGLEFAPLDKTLDFIPTALQLMRQVVRLYPEQFTLSDQGQGNKHLHYLAGGRRIDDYLYGILSLEELLEEWRGQSARFEKETEAFRIYG